jgi:hypothetical protein
VIAYRVMLDVSGELLIYVARLLRARRRELGARNGTRLLTCYRQALFAVAWFRDKPDIPRLGKGSGLSRATSCRYLSEVIGVLAAQAPDLRAALARPVSGTMAIVVRNVTSHVRVIERITHSPPGAVSIRAAGLPQRSS